MKNVLLLFGIAMFCLGCSERLPSSDVSSSKLWVECNLEAGKQPIAKLMTTVGVTGIFDPLYPEDGRVYLANGQENDFSLNYENQEYVFLGEEEFIKVGQNFNLYAFLESDEDYLIESESSVRVVQNTPFDSLLILNNALDDGNDDVLDLRLQFPEGLKNALVNLHLEIELESVFEVVENGDTMEVENLTGHEIEYSRFFNDLQNYEVMTHMNGVLFDTENVESDHLDLRILVLEKLRKDEKLKRVNLTLKSTSENYFKYHKWLSNVFEENSVNPSTIYTNIKRGYGALTSTATRKYVSEVK